MIYKVLTVLCCCLFIAQAWSAEDPRNVPGYEKGIACAGDATFTYDLIIPAAYAAQPERRFPTLFISAPTGNPSLKSYPDWANEHNFVVVAINNSRNGPLDNNIRAQDLVLQSIEERGLRMHSCLNYASGHSGGASASAHLVSRKPMLFAGLHLSIHSGGGAYAPAHQAVTVYAGLNDDVHPWSSVERAISRYRSAGNPLLVETHPGGHKGASAKQVMGFVEWMFEQTMLAHPGLDRDGLLQSVELIREKIQEANEIEAPLVRIEALNKIMGINGILKTPLVDELAADWGKTLTAALEKADETEQFWLVVESSEMPLQTKLDRELRKDLQVRLKAFQKQDVFKDELMAYGAFKKVEEFEVKATTDSKRQKLMAGYKEIAERFPETRYGKESADKLNEDKPK